MESSLLMTFFSNNWAVKMRVKNVENTSSMYFFPSKQTLSCLEKNLHQILRVCTDLHTNCLYLCVGKISYISYITNAILASMYSVLDTIQQHFSVFLFLQNCISSKKISSNNKMSHQKGSFCNILRFPNSSLFHCMQKDTQQKVGR